MAMTANCTIVGQCSCTNSGSFGSYGTGTAYAGANSSNYYVGLIKITTPAFSGKFTGITLNLWVKSQYHTNINLRYALATSDENKLLYRKTYNVPDDSNQIATGIFELKSMSTSTYKTFTLTIAPEEMLPNTDYYLFFWGSNNASFVTIGTPDNHTIDVEYEPKTGSFVQYNNNGVIVKCKVLRNVDGAAMRCKVNYNNNGETITL